MPVCGAGCPSVVPSFWKATGAFRAATGVAAAPQRGANPPFATEGGLGVVENNNVRHICFKCCDRVCSATTPAPLLPEEGTTLGARHCSGRRPPPAPPKEGSNRVCPYSWMFVTRSPTFDLRSSLFTLGKADASIALLSLNRRLHFSLFTFHFSLRAGAVSGRCGYFCGV